MAQAARSFSKCFSSLWVRACFSPWVVPWQPRGGGGNDPTDWGKALNVELRNPDCVAGGGRYT